MTHQTGVLPSQRIKSLIAGGAVKLSAPADPDQVQPASLDLRLGDQAFRMRASFLPGKGKSVAARRNALQMHRIDLRDGAVLEKNCVYLVPLMESLALPKSITAAANAKSSTGRLDVLTRIITDEGVEFDRVPPGYSGPLYAEICPRSFSILVKPGQRLCQIRFREGPTAPLTDPELLELHGKTSLLDGDPVIKDGLGFSVDLRPNGSTLVGYRAKPHTAVVDLSDIAGHAPRDYWEEVHSTNGRIILDPGAFYILVSRESVTIPPGYAAEMAPYLAMMGEFRVHYAGFFDPGFGCTESGGKGSRGVLEVRCHEAPFVLEHAQLVGRLIFEQMQAVPDRLYGVDMASNYQGQGLKLSKHFSKP